MQRTTQSDLAELLTDQEYQDCVQQCVIEFLALNYTQKIKSAPQKISLRICERPPSIQVIQYPLSGVHEGASRLREHLEMPPTSTTESGLYITEQPIVVASVQDLTRECIILTLEDKTISTLIKAELIAHPNLDHLQKLRCIHPKIFIVMQRYLMGIEKEDGVSVPFNIVEHDKETFEYLSTMPRKLST